MFAIYRKNVGGRIHDRYFKDYDKAKAEILADVERAKSYGVTEWETIDRMNTDKGFYEYEWRTKNFAGEDVVLAIVDGYFEDNPNA